MAIAFHPGQSDLELAACDTRVLLEPRFGTAPLTNIEDLVNGGIDLAKIGSSSKFITVGNHEKKAGVKYSGKPTMNDVKSAGKGSPTRRIASESPKGITYVPQETKLINLQNSWGFTPDMVSAPSVKGGITIGIPELPARTQWRAVLLAWDSYNGKDVWLYWIANHVEVGEREDQSLVDSNVIEHGVSLSFDTDPAVGLPVIFGACGDGFRDLMAATDTGGFYPAVTGITVTPSTTTATVALGANHTRQLVVADSNSLDRTATATYVSSDPTKATVSPVGLVTGVAAGTATITATYLGKTATCSVTVS